MSIKDDASDCEQHFNCGADDGRMATSGPFRTVSFEDSATDSDCDRHTDQSSSGDPETEGR